MSDIGAIKTLIRRAIKFADWAAGEGICPAGHGEAEEGERNPEEFLFSYSTETGDEDWDTLADRIASRIDKIEAENSDLLSGEYLERVVEERDRLKKVLTDTRAIVCDGAMTGFNCHDGDWADRLYKNNGTISDVLREREALNGGGND